MKPEALKEYDRIFLLIEERIKQRGESLLPLIRFMRAVQQYHGVTFCRNSRGVLYIKEVENVH